MLYPLVSPFILAFPLLFGMRIPFPVSLFVTDADLANHSSLRSCCQFRLAMMEGLHVYEQ